MKRLTLILLFLPAFVVAFATSRAPNSKPNDVLVLATVKSADDCRLVEYRSTNDATEKPVTRHAAFLTLTVDHCFKGDCGPTVDVAIVVSAIYHSTWMATKKSDVAPLVGRHVLIDLQGKDDEGKFCLVAKMRGMSKYTKVYRTADLDVPYAGGQDATWLELKVTTFDQSLPLDLQEDDLIISNAFENPNLTGMLTTWSGTYNEAEAMGDKRRDHYRRLRSLIMSRFATDGSWRTSPRRGEYLTMLACWRDPSALQECAEEVRQDVNCKIFNGYFPPINDNDLKLQVIKTALPSVAATVFEAHGNPDWDKEVLRVALQRLGEDPKLDMKIFGAATIITGDNACTPRNPDLKTWEYAPHELEACKDRTRAVIVKYLREHQDS